MPAVIRGRFIYVHWFVAAMVNGLRCYLVL